MLFRKDIARSCQYCTHGVQLDEERILCSKKGLTSITSSCRRFRYDPLKRIPIRKKAVDFAKYDQEDFSL